MTSENVYIVQPVFQENTAEALRLEAIALIESAGAAYAGTLYAKIREINPATFLGEGKVAELRDRLDGLDVTVLFNGDLSPSQTVNLSEALDGKKVIDRTTLILDIFALRAESSEGKLQVELAQLRYLYPRLKGKGEALSRLGGGIGTRGPGETQLETDRRHIRMRIRSLEDKLSKTEQRRGLQVERRKKDGARTVALVGYTNTGKSTLLNALTGSDVFVKDAPLCHVGSDFTQGRDRGNGLSHNGYGRLSARFAASPHRGLQVNAGKRPALRSCPYSVRRGRRF